MNPYKILGIPPNASKDEVKKAYAKLSDEYSLDKFIGSPEEALAEDKLLELNSAYSNIINNFKYQDIRNMIETDQFIAAETELNLISDKGSAEWNYLKGFVMLKKGWFQAGVTHLKNATDLDPSNQEYKETMAVITRKITAMRMQYARMHQKKGGSNDMCGGGGGDMCGGGGGNQGGGGGIDPNILNMMMGNMGGGAAPGGMASGLGGAANNGQNPAGNGMPGGMPGMGGGGQNPMQNMLLQSLMNGGGGNMCGGAPGGGNMCGGGPGGGKMC